MTTLSVGYHGVGKPIGSATTLPSHTGKLCCDAMLKNVCTHMQVEGEWKYSIQFNFTWQMHSYAVDSLVHS